MTVLLSSPSSTLPLSALPSTTLDEQGLAGTASLDATSSRLPIRDAGQHRDAFVNGSALLTVEHSRTLEHPGPTEAL